MTTDAGQAALIDGIRALLADAASVREVSMFGGRAFMVNDKLVVSAQRHGDLLVRVDPGHHAELVARPGASTAEMGAGRSMGEGWIAVSARSISDGDQLSQWITTALDHNRRMTDGSA